MLMIVKVASDPLLIVGFVYFLLAVVHCHAYLCLYEKNKALGGRRRKTNFNWSTFAAFLALTNAYTKILTNVCAIFQLLLRRCHSVLDIFIHESITKLARYINGQNAS